MHLLVLIERTRQLNLNNLRELEPNNQVQLMFLNPMKETTRTATISHSPLRFDVHPDVTRDDAEHNHHLLPQPNEHKGGMH